jgi:Sec-independent protein translocase protein TatA
MFALTGGELSIVLFIFALVWGAAMLPRVLERVAVLSLRRSREGR